MRFAWLGTNFGESRVAARAVLGIQRFGPDFGDGSCASCSDECCVTCFAVLCRRRRVRLRSELAPEFQPTRLS